MTALSFQKGGNPLVKLTIGQSAKIAAWFRKGNTELYSK